MPPTSGPSATQLQVISRCKPSGKTAASVTALSVLLRVLGRAMPISRGMAPRLGISASRALANSENSLVSYAMLRLPSSEVSVPREKGGVLLTTVTLV